VVRDVAARFENAALAREAFFETLDRGGAFAPARTVAAAPPQMTRPAWPPQGTAPGEPPPGMATAAIAPTGGHYAPVSPIVGTSSRLGAPLLPAVPVALGQARQGGSRGKVACSGCWSSSAAWVSLA
jgi:hypothetical protein